MLLIGGHALRGNGIILNRNSLDYDYICSYEEYETYINNAKEAKTLAATYPLSANKMVAKLTNNDIIEFEIAWNEEKTSTEMILEYEANNEIASLETLLMLKLSHRYLRNSPHFYKTMNDIRLLREKGVTISNKMKKILKIREKETYNYNHPRLNQNKKDFFDAAVKYTYDHDSIHKAVSYGEMPAYEYFKSDVEEVYCDKNKFFQLSDLIKLHSVAEESMVLAIERSLVPFPGKMTPKQAFKFALMKVCTSITSGWFREFAWENHNNVLEIYSDEYFDKFNEALKKGLIPLHSNEVML